MRRLITSVFNSPGLRQSAVTIVGNTMATGLSAVALILLSRMLGPVRFGEFSVGFAIVLIVARINDAGLSATLLKFAAGSQDKKTINVLFSQTLKYKLMLSLIILLTGAALTPWLTKILNFPHPWLLFASFIFGIANAYYEQLLAMLQSLHSFTMAVGINAVQAGSKLLLVTSLFLINVSPTLLVFFAYMVGPVIPVILSRRFLPAWVKLKITTEDHQFTQKILEMAKHSSVAFIAAGIIENVDVLFVQRYLNTYETGLLSGVSKIAMMFALIAYSLGNVLNPRVARYHEVKHLSKYIKKSLLIVLITSVAFLAFLPFARVFILLTIGAEYLPGLPILLILVAASFLTIASVPFIALFYSYDASWYFSISGIIQLIIVVLGNAVFVPIYGLEAAAWTRLGTRIFLFVFTAFVSLLIFRLKYATVEKTSPSSS